MADENATPPTREQGPRSLPYAPPAAAPPPERTRPENPDMVRTPGYEPPNFQPTRKD